jgi:hypothetical protein
MKSKIPLAVRFCTAFVLLCSVGVGAAQAADLSQAKVRQKFNVVTLAPNLQASAHPVAQGAVVRDDNVVRTGTESRAELEFTDLTLARIGANSIFTFDAQARSLECGRGAVLFSKPANSGRVEIRSGAVTAAITGSTGFVSTSIAGGHKKGERVTSENATTMLGMLEGKLHGASSWRDGRGQAHSFQFSLGAGEMLVAQPGRPPTVVQFDIPRFLATSPLVKGFSGALLNPAQMQRAVADYQSDERRGFVEATTVPVSQAANLAWVNYTAPNHNSFDASVDQLGSNPETGEMGGGGGGDFVPVGGDGLIRGQLVWATNADLDLHLILPDNQEVFFANPVVTFNQGRAEARLDHDNVGPIIDAPPNLRVENIAVNGTLSPGNYTFFARSFFTPNGSDAFTLTVSDPNGNTQVIHGTLSNQQNSTQVVVQGPHSG